MGKSNLVDHVAALEAENAAARGVIAQANNSLYGSCCFFLSVNGGDADMSHLSRPIEELKDRARRAYALEGENARLREALEGLLKFYDGEPMPSGCARLVVAARARAALSREAVGKDQDPHQRPHGAGVQPVRENHHGKK